MRVGFSPSSSSKSELASTHAAAGSSPVISPQPLIAALVSIFT